MHDIKWIRDNPEAFDKALVNRNKEPLSAYLITLDSDRRRLITESESGKAELNALSKQIAQAKSTGDTVLANELMQKVAIRKALDEGFAQTAKNTQKELDDLLAGIPNVPAVDVPEGKDEHDNVEVRTFRTSERRLIQKEQWLKQHFELGEVLGQMDFETAAKISGARFVMLKSQLARLERALGQFMLDVHTIEHGYTEVSPPYLVKAEAAFGTGNLPKFKEDLFKTKRSGDLADYVADWVSECLRAGAELNDIDLNEVKFQLSHDILTDKVERLAKHSEPLYLIPTAEIPLTNMVREQILDESVLPFRFTALTPSFRSEAGSAGRDTRGMIRVHQFVKAEMVSITTAEKSVEEHERMLACAETILKKLELPFRTITLCTGDMGFSSRKTYDIEVWLPGQNAYREISSCSNCGDFQARRMNARYRPAGEKGTRFVHTLNGSGVAVGRALVAVLENYQNEDGTITVPTVLRPYMGGLETIG